MLSSLSMRTDSLLSRREAVAVAACSAGLSRLLLAAESAEPAPRFMAKTLTGQTFNNQSLLNKVVLVEFWATWCPYCKIDAESVEGLARRVREGWARRAGRGRR